MSTMITSIHRSNVRLSMIMAAVRHQIFRNPFDRMNEAMTVLLHRNAISRINRWWWYETMGIQTIRGRSEQQRHQQQLYIVNWSNHDDMHTPTRMFIIIIETETMTIENRALISTKWIRHAKLVAVAIQTMKSISVSIFRIHSNNFILTDSSSFYDGHRRNSFHLDQSSYVDFILVNLIFR